jgi:transposase
LVAGNTTLEAAAEPMLRAGASLRYELAGLERHVRSLAQDDPTCRLPMTMPAVGAVVALTFKSAVDDPARFSSSKVGPWVGLTPSRQQSGERDVMASPKPVTPICAAPLCQAATVMMNRARGSWLRTWASRVAKRRGTKRAMVALARRIGVILHRMWLDGRNFCWEGAPVPIHA